MASFNIKDIGKAFANPLGPLVGQAKELGSGLGLDFDFSGKPQTEETGKPLAAVAPYLPGFYGAGQELFQKQKPLGAEASPLLFNAGKAAAGGRVSPALQNVISAALNPVYSQLTEKVLPGISSGASLAGATGGAREDILKNQAIEDYLQTAGDITSKLTYGEYLRAPELLSNALKLEALPLGLYGGTISTQPPQTEVKNKPSQLASGLAGALGGAGLGYSLGGPYGALGGAGLGFLSGGIR